jgi:quinol monooxygenase YgiN
MISLMSIWELIDGCPEELKRELEALGDKVKDAEPDTLLYLVHIQAPSPLDPNNNPIEPPPSPIPLLNQKEAIFLEIYKDEVAFSRHINGPVFQTFLKQYGKYFKPDPSRPGWPITKSGVFARISGFIRESAN